MTTSGVATFSVTESDIINGAFQQAGIIAVGETLSAADYAIGRQWLNMMTKTWQARQIGLWLNQLVALHLTANQQSYLLGPTGDRCGTNFGATTVATAALAGASTLVVTDVSTTAGHIDNGDAIGIELDDGTMQWTTVNGAPSGETVTLTAVLTTTVAIGNMVFTYDHKTLRPLEVLEARLRDSSGIDTPLFQIARKDYMELPLKSSSGKANQFYYDPQLTNGVLYAWSTAGSVRDRIIMTIKRPVYDFVAVGDTPDFPIEWAEPIIANLAVKIAPSFERFNVLPTLKTLADQALADAEGFDREEAPTQFVPYYQPRGR